MKLSYRGVSYESSSPALEGVETGMTGNYRGQAVHFTYPRHIPAQSVCEMKYRGTAYRTTPTGSIESATSAGYLGDAATVFDTQPALSTIPASISRHSRMTEARRIHRDNIYRRLQHRLEVARSRGDQALVQLLEREMQQIL